jgi:large subunit ribosomal protein L7A
VSEFWEVIVAMPNERLLSSRKKTVGAKQTLKAIERGQAKAVYVVIEPILQLSALKGIPVIQVDTMQSLGKACHIEVGCAVAAIVEE